MGNNDSTPSVSHEGGDTLRDELNRVLRDPELTVSDKALVRKARSIVTHEYSYFKTDYKLTINISGYDRCFQKGDETTKLIVQRDESDQIEAVYNGRTIRMHLRDVIKKAGSVIGDFFSKLPDGITGTILSALSSCFIMGLTGLVRFLFA